MLEIFALIVLGVLCAAAIWLVVLVGNIPGKIAKGAGHPQAEAINVLAWIGLLTGGIGWALALVWAKTRPLSANAELEARIAALEEKLQAAGGES